MRTSFVDFFATDGVKLQGLLFETEHEKKTIVIHVHGMAGSFYENSFIPVMADCYTKNGLAFLSFNNRGHDYLCDLVKTQNGETDSVMGGAAYEIIEESLYDIEGAITYVKALGYNDIILQGHSSGANKIVFSMSQRPLDVLGIALLSPCDDIGLHVDDVGNKRAELIKHAETLINAGTPTALMPENTFFSYWLSAQTYLNCFEDGSSLDTFPYRDAENEFRMFRNIEVPIFVSFGTDGEFLLQEPEYAYSILNQKKSPKATLSFHKIDGASHSYTGKEDELVLKIVDWIKSQFTAKTN